MHRVMQWAAILGFGLIISGQYFSNLPYSLYPAVDFWLNSPGLIFIKLGVIMVCSRDILVDASWLRTGLELGTPARHYFAAGILGSHRTRLRPLVWFWKDSLTFAQCALAALTLILLMIGLSYVKRTGAGRLGLASVLPPEPRRVSG